MLLSVAGGFKIGVGNMDRLERGMTTSATAFCSGAIEGEALTTEVTPHRFLFVTGKHKGDQGIIAKESLVKSFEIIGF